MLGLDGKVILVTGGNRGIGAAIVELLDQLGATVVFTSRTGEGGKGFGYQADVTDITQMEALIEKVEAEHGAIYGVVCNAGVTRDKMATNITPDDWDLVIDTNLTGVWNSIQPLLPKMYERKEGSLVLISSIVGEKGNIGQANYAAAKGGVIALGKALALECARYNIRSNVVAPGFVDTDMTKDLNEKVRDVITKQIPMRRFGKPEEIAWAVAYLLSPIASSFVTGEVIAVNGGHHT